MENNTGTYTQMYNGPLVFAPDDVEYDPRYYSLNAGFMISPTHRLAQDRPTVTVCIPAEKLIGNTEGGMPLKRLRYYLNHMKSSMLDILKASMMKFSIDTSLFKTFQVFV